MAGESNWLGGRTHLCPQPLPRADPTGGIPDSQGSLREARTAFQCSVGSGGQSFGGRVCRDTRPGQLARQPGPRAGGRGGGDEDGDGEKKWSKKGGCVPIGTARRFKL